MDAPPPPPPPAARGGLVVVVLLVMVAALVMAVAWVCEEGGIKARRACFKWSEGRADSKENVPGPGRVLEEWKGLCRRWGWC